MVLKGNEVDLEEGEGLSVLIAIAVCFEESRGRYNSHTDPLSFMRMNENTKSKLLLLKWEIFICIRVIIYQPRWQIFIIFIFLCGLVASWLQRRLFHPELGDTLCVEFHMFLLFLEWFLKDLWLPRTFHKHAILAWSEETK